MLFRGVGKRRPCMTQLQIPPVPIREDIPQPKPTVTKGGDGNAANCPLHGLRWTTAWWDPKCAATSLQQRSPGSTKHKLSRPTSLLPLTKKHGLSSSTERMIFPPHRCSRALLATALLRQPS